MQITYKKLNNAVETFNLIGLETRRQVKERYLELSKEYHPDTKNGNIEKFQKINEAYKVLQYYMDSFKFSFSHEEFKAQHPFCVEDGEKWSLW